MKLAHIIYLSIIAISLLLILSSLYFRTFDVKQDIDSPATDAFNRQRMSLPYVIFDSKQVADNDPLKWDQAITGSGITSRHIANRASTEVKTTAGEAGTFTRQTFRAFDYKPGQSQILMMTGVPLKETPKGLLKGVAIRYGQFDDNNGLFFEYKEDRMRICVRSSVTDSPVDFYVDINRWNVDKLNGRGPSGIKADWSKIHIFIIDYGWLGADRIRFCLMYDGIIYPVHYHNTTNLKNSVYVSHPNTCIRYQVVTTAESPAITSEQICAMIATESGSFIGTGVPGNISTTLVTTDNSTTNIYPILSIRLKTTHHMKSVIDIIAEVLCTTTGHDMEWFLINDPIYTAAPTWTEIENSAVEYYTGDGTNTITGGYQMKNGFIATGNNNNSVQNGTSSLLGANLLSLGYNIDGTATTICLAARNLAAKVGKYYGAMSWKEL